VPPLPLLHLPSIEDSILHGSNYDQKLLLKFSSPAPSPPTPRLSSPPASPIVPYKSTSPFDELNELDFLPVASLSPPPTFTCRRPNLRSTPVLRLGIRHTTPFEPSECCRRLSPAISYLNLENATFIKAFRSAPFLPSSVTHGYSETPGPLFAPYIDPPIDSSVSPPSHLNDLNLYSFSTSSSSEGDGHPNVAALDLSLQNRNKGKRPYRRATFSRKVSRKSSSHQSAVTLPVEKELLMPNPISPQPSTSQPYISSDSD
jgi:hypothetical protein